jgi:hypothetical protein
LAGGLRLRELAERHELGLGSGNWEALRAADTKIINAVDTAEFYLQAEKLAQAVYVNG